MYLITGATGIVGRPLVNRLVDKGAAVRAVTRDRRAASAVLPAGVDIVEGDPGRPETIADAFDGVSALFLHPRAAAAAPSELVALAGQRGVRRVVALSAINVDDPADEQPSRFRGDRNKEAEAAVVASGLEWVSVRAGFFAKNTLNTWGAQIRAGDTVRGPYADFAQAPIHEGDLGMVLADVLRTNDFVGRKLVATGPDSITHAKMVGLIGEVLGRPLRYAEVPGGAAANGMLALGLPRGFVDASMKMYAAGSGRPAPVSRDVETVLGRPARGYAEWVADNAAALRG